MENVYKNDFLKDISTHAELLVYDWSNGGEIELVVEDIENIGMTSSIEIEFIKNLVLFNTYTIISITDFDRFEKESPKMLDWRFFNFEGEYTEARIKYTEEAAITHSFCSLPLFHCPDLVIQPEDIATRIRIFEEV